MTSGVFIQGTPTYLPDKWFDFDYIDEEAPLHWQFSHSHLGYRVVYQHEGETKYGPLFPKSGDCASWTNAKGIKSYMVKRAYT